MRYSNEEQTEQLTIEVPSSVKETKRGLTSISTYSLKVVKETTSRYDVENKISCPKDSAKLFREVLDMENLAEEVLAMITLNTKNKVTGVFEVHQGSLNSSIVHPRSVYSRALLQNAASIIIAHNHPSGDTHDKIARPLGKTLV